jgi:rhamnose transport system permease protein
MDEKRDLVAKTRLIQENSLKNTLIELFTKWEMLLGVIFVLMVIFFSNLSPYFLDYFNLMNASFQFSEKAIMALPMIFIIMCGDIDISVASIIALVAYAVGTASSFGVSTVSLIGIGLAVGAAAGFVNGLLITTFDMPPIAVTLATQSIYRGIAQAALEERAMTSYPDRFGYFGQEFIKGTMIPFELVLFIVLAIIMGVILHKTKYGRRVYAIGNSKQAALFSGIKVDKIRIINFTMMGLFSGIAGILLTSRILSARSNIATGWDLEVITLVVLGGVSITGGKGSLYGVVIASFLVGYLKFGMGLLKLSGTIMTIVIGSLLIVAVLLPRLLDGYKAKRKMLFQQYQAAHENQ